MPVPASPPGSASRRRGLAHGSPNRSMRPGSGGGDLVSERFELADVATYVPLGLDPGVAEPDTEIVVTGVGFGEQVPEHDANAPGHGDDRAFGAAWAGDASVALPEKRGGARRTDCDLAQRSGKVWVAVAGGAAAPLPPSGLVDPRREPGRRGQMSSRWKATMSTPISAMIVRLRRVRHQGLGPAWPRPQ
jgi:hypothetical protein